MSEPCPWCGAPNAHYMTHVCAGCECWFREVRIPGEPQMGTYLEGEPNPDCPELGDYNEWADVIRIQKIEEALKELDKETR